MYYSRGSVPRLIFEGPWPRTLQVFSVKIGGSNWPLQVYGLIAIRDFVDPQRNMIFNRDRDEYQIVTEEVCSCSHMCSFFQFFVSSYFAVGSNKYCLLTRGLYLLSYVFFL